VTIMRIYKIIIAVTIVSLLAFSTSPILWRARAQPVMASLTGTVVGDWGVDTDGDGAFDYLELGVEVNVTDSGDYEVEIQGLLDSGHNYISVSGHKSEYLDAGIQVVNVSLYGPTIYVSGLNPVNVSEIALYSVDYVPPFEYVRYWLDSVYDIPLSQEYSYTEFDSPLADIEAIFVVHPDGRVVMGGALNYTNMEPRNTGPSMHGVAEIEKSDALTLVSADFTLMIPPEEASQFPFNSSAFTLLSEYSGGLLTTTISGSTIFPHSLASQFPFNVTDFTVMGEYGGDTVTGNATVYILAGFPLGEIDINFQGNNTYVYLNGSTTVIFGDYPDIGEINATVLDGLLQQLNSTIPGQGPGSLYNMTQGLFECTRLNTTTAPYGAIGATVDFEAEFQGDLIQALVNMSGQPASMYEVLNATWSSVESGSFVVTYAHALKEADMDLVFVNNMTYLIDNMLPILPDILPSEEAEFIESILNTTYCTVISAEVSLDYENGQATITVTATIQDDFNAEINYIKSMFLTYGDVPQPSTSQLQAMNETQIDITDFRMSLNLTETSVEADVSGFAVLPPLDWIDATSFELYRFFNITASEDEPPGEGERLKVTVEGGSNATHAVTIFRPVTVPEPDISDASRMTWNNQSISSLKDLIFRIEGDSTPPVIGSPVHTPEIPDADEAVTVSVNVTDVFGVRLDGVILSYSTDGGETWDNVTMNKTTGDIYEGEIPGLPAGTDVQYRIIAYDNAGNSAINDNNGQNYAYAVPHVAFWMEWWFWVIIIVVIGALAGAVYFLKKMRAPKTPTQ
jgi:hypothetical protein